MIKYEDGKLSFHFSDLVEQMDTETKRELAEQLIWDKEIFDEFVEALMGDRIVTKNFNSYIHEARMKMYEMLPELAKNVVRTLIHEVDQLQKDKERLDKWSWALWHRWPDEYCMKKPELPSFVSAGWPTEEEVNKKLQDK